MTSRPEMLHEMLSQTLEDHRLSRGEKKAIRQVLGDMQLTEHERGLVRSKAFELAADQMESREQRQVLEWLAGVTGVLEEVACSHVSGAAAAFFSDVHDCVGELEQRIRKVRRSLDICMFTITDNQLAGPICNAHERGVAVRIITDDEKMEDTGSDIERFIRAGIDVRTDRSESYMHHKFAVVDNSTLITGSYNWTKSAARANKENFVICSDPNLVRDFSGAFERLWDEFGQPQA